MPLREVPGSFHFKQSGKGSVWSQSFRCSINDIVPFVNAELPQFGDPHPLNPNVRVVDVDAPEDINGFVVWTVTYSTERQLAESFCDESVSMSCETINNLSGRKWKTAGTPIALQLPISTPIFTLSIRLRDTEAPFDKCADYAHAINLKIFRGRPAGTLRFEGIDADNSYATNGDIISVASVYKFSYRKKPWNFFWREPIVKLNAADAPLHWHDNPDEPQYYTTDQTKIGTPVYVDGIAGTADWDEIDGDYYETCDFAEVFGIPKKAGDE